MSCPDCTRNAPTPFSLGSCETELLDALKTELFKTLAALPPHVQHYLSCRLGLAIPSAQAAFDVGRLIASLPAIVQLLIQLGVLPVPSPANRPSAPQSAASDLWLRALAAAAAAFAAVAAPSNPTEPAPTSPSPAAPVDPAGYLPRAVRRCA